MKNSLTIRKVFIRIGGLVLLLGLLKAAEWMASRGYFRLPSSFDRLVELVIVLTLSFSLATLWIRFSERRLLSLLEQDLEIEQRLLFIKLYEFGLYLLAFLVVLWKAGVSLSNLTLSAGFFASALALALRDLISAFLSWYVILIKKPFRIGDQVRIGDDSGKVIHIGTFFITLESGGGVLIRLPNNVIFSRAVTVNGPERHILQFKILLRELPDELDNALQQCKENIQALVTEQERVALRLDVENGKWQLSGIAVLHTSELAVRGRIFQHIHAVFGTNIQFVSA